MAYPFQNRVSNTRFTNKKNFTTLSLKRSLTSLDQIRLEREKESDQIRERGTKLDQIREREKELDQIREREKELARPGACAAWGSRGPGRAAWVGLIFSSFFSSSSAFFFFFLLALISVLLVLLFCYIWAYKSSL